MLDVLSSTIDATEPVRPAPLRRNAMIAAAVETQFAGDPEYQQHLRSTSLTREQGLVDYLFAVEGEPHLPDEVFDRLRWGGVFVYVANRRDHLHQLAERFRQRGFVVHVEAKRIYERRLGIRLPIWSPRRWLMVARKVLLIRPREITERFTYHVELQPSRTSPGEWIVLKEIPSLQRVIARLRARFTDVPQNELERRALKFTDKIFPLFLTREAAILRILERHLPSRFRERVPRVLELEQDGRGYVRRLWMNWLRNGGEPISQLEFARQSAELLMALHDIAAVIHLDLRLDNMVLTPNGVGFVDFGSSVRVDENIGGNPLLNTIFGELMRTSEIQRMLTKMKQSGSVTSHVINAGHHKVDKAVDLFYLAVQINYPTANPDLRDLIHYDPQSAEAQHLKQLTDEVLRPKDPAHPTYRSAKDILHGIEAIERKLRRPSHPVR